MKHKQSETLMAVKAATPSIDDKSCQKQMLTKLDRLMRENTCSYILQFYGALCHEAIILNRIWSKPERIDPIEITGDDYDE
ncbi:unnamed protein product [Rotaria magnacalcarata]|uniref:Uncharacterized protein n=3 Tax=Rotaria magnacalcarata TaxID=392030 RepID=A0A815BCK0_9BILA|nr:unnamed protein product [Rotaria magnacalcarata]CAF2203720.1 unnamed protein product [Rotaria magnacalcarata]CAF3774670.1 unnamed protein product [Rotaria magnacalcarata]CAF5136814.1 unnamed protein product [Rotaria magnacalcarata]CAF5188105.1 unnamed protein product [Rotaria magnacalcarata]